MEDNFSELLMSALVKNLLVAQTDLYGNKISNPIDQAINKWAENNKDKILGKVSEILTIEVLADRVSEKLLEAFKGWSNYDRQKYISEVNTKITEKLAERIAARIDIDKTI